MFPQLLHKQVIHHAGHDRGIPSCGKAGWESKGYPPPMLGGLKWDPKGASPLEHHSFSQRS